MISNAITLFWSVFIRSYIIGRLYRRALYLVFLCIILMMGSCNPDEPTTVPLTIQFKDECLATGSSEKVQFTAHITVEALDGSQRDTYFDESVSGGSNNKTFDIDIPESGTYVTDVLVFGDECSECCHSYCDSEPGYPMWRGNEDFISMGESPENIGVEVKLINCLCASC